jgi:polyphosphate kinase
MPLRHLESFITGFNLSHASIVEGGTYHNLKDLADFPVKAKSLTYPKWPAINSVHIPAGDTLFRHILQKDIVVHAPYQNYETVLRFFNEAVIDESVEEIFVTLYRVANDSRIVSALISAARNGKKVSVMVELKARFDEGNNIKWAKRMKDAGIKIIYSDNALKVHAKIALVKRKIDGNTHYSGLLSTGNLNESTARFYTDHILLTTHQEMLMEIELLFQFLSKKKKSQEDTSVPFHHLLVAQFNLQSRFIALIDREIEHARAGRPAAITIKLNNLEEEVMISKLYEASNAGVKIELIVRSICRLKPGIEGQSEHIRIRRIVDTYLEHGRVYLFHNNGHEELYMGSADWMNRNIYRRIEVCFPVYDPAIKEEIKKILALQLQDNRQAVWLNRELKNIPVNTPAAEKPLRSQEAIYRMLQQSNVPQEYEPVEP